MGCPPDPVDVAIWRSQDRVAQLVERERAYLQEINRIDAWLADLAALCRDRDALAAIMADRQQQDGALSEPRWERIWGEHQDLDDAIADEHLQRDKVKQAETRLCIARETVLRLAAHVQGVPAERRAELEEVAAQHRAHRSEDRDQWLAWLRQRIQSHRHYLGLAEWQAYHGQLQTRIDRAEAEIRRVQALPLQEILLSRRLFGQNPEDFLLPQPAQTAPPA